MQTSTNSAASVSSESSHNSNSALSLKHLAGSTLLLCCLSLGAVALNNMSWGLNSISILWPSTGCLIGILLCVLRKQWPVYIAIGFVVDVLVNILLLPSGPFTRSLYQAGCNVIEVSLAAWLLYATFAQKRDLSRSGQLIRLLAFGAILAPAVASLVAACYMTGSFGIPTLRNFGQWFTADALGGSIVIPLYLGLQKQWPLSRRQWLEVAFLLSLLCAVSSLVFWQSSLSLLYVILPFLLIVEVQLGIAGSAMSLLAVSAIGGYFTARGHGPVTFGRFASLSSRTLGLQFFIFVCMLVLYVMEVVIAQRNRFAVNLRLSEQRFRLLAESSSDMIMLQDINAKRLYVSPAVKTMLGWEPEEFLSLSREQSIHPDDLAGLIHMYDECHTGKASNTLAFRCKKKDGSYLWVQDNLVLSSDSGKSVQTSFINVVRDISIQKATEEELHRALNAAENQASVDALTGMANRRSFDKYLNEEWCRAIRAQAPISLLMLDVDYFKRYNDLYGHLSGDSCLKKIAEAIASCIHRVTDLPVRYGGEEFAVILPNTDEVGALSLAEQIRIAVQQRQIFHEANPVGFVTVSVGCSTQLPKLGSSYSDLIRSADQALYEAKSAGRNCVRVRRG